MILHWASIPTGFKYPVCLFGVKRGWLIETMGEEVKVKLNPPPLPHYTPSLGDVATVSESMLILGKIL